MEHVVSDCIVEILIEKYRTYRNIRAPAYLASGTMSLRADRAPIAVEGLRSWSGAYLAMYAAIILLNRACQERMPPNLEKDESGIWKSNSDGMVGQPWVHVEWVTVDVTPSPEVKVSRICRGLESQH